MGRLGGRHDENTVKPLVELYGVGFEVEPLSQARAVISDGRFHRDSCTSSRLTRRVVPVTQVVGQLTHPARGKEGFADET